MARDIKLFIICICFVIMIPLVNCVFLDAKKHPSFEDSSNKPPSQPETNFQQPIDLKNSQGEKSDRLSIDLESGTLPLNVNKKIMNNGKDSCFVDDILCILVEVSNLGNTPLNDVKIIEYTESEFDILYPTYYFRTSTIEEIVEIEKFEHPFLQNNEVNNFSELKKEIITSKDPVSEYLMNKHFYNKNCSLDEFNAKSILALNKSDLIKLLNDAIIDKDMYNGQKYVLLSNSTKRMIESIRGQNPNDYEIKLSNRLLLENAYPNYINQNIINCYAAPYARKLWKVSHFDGEKDLFSIKAGEIYSSEYILYKYYIKPLKEGSFSTYTVLNIKDDDGKSNILYYPLKINIINNSPEFDIQVDIAKLDLDEDASNIIRYDIRYLGGSYESCCYNITIENSTQYVVDKYNFTRNFNKGKTESIEAKITYPKPGIFNIPGITIDNIKYTPEEHVTVEWSWFKSLNRYYPLLSIIIIFFSMILYVYEVRHIINKKP